MLHAPAAHTSSLPAAETPRPNTRRPAAAGRRPWHGDPGGESGVDTWDRGLLTNTGRSVKFPQFDRGELQKPLLVKLNLSPLAQGPQKLFLMGQLTGSASIRSAPSQAEGPQSTEDNQPRSGHIESDPKQPGKLPLCDCQIMSCSLGERSNSQTVRPICG